MGLAARGYFLTRQTIGTREVIGAAIIVVGLALFASFGHPAAGVDNATGPDWVASILVICAACVALLVFANRGSLSMKAARSVGGGRLGGEPGGQRDAGRPRSQERLEKNPPWHAVVAVAALVGSVVISSARAGEGREPEAAVVTPAQLAD